MLYDAQDEHVHATVRSVRGSLPARGVESMYFLG